MSIAFRQFKLYFKVVLIGTVVLLTSLVLFMNRNNSANVWFFGTHENVNVLRLILVTAGGTMLVTWILSITRKLVREWREVSQQTAIARQTAELNERAKQLQDREKRIDEKVQQALSKEP